MLTAGIIVAALGATAFAILAIWDHSIEQRPHGRHRAVDPDDPQVHLATITDRIRRQTVEVERRADLLRDIADANGGRWTR